MIVKKRHQVLVAINVYPLINTNILLTLQVLLTFLYFDYSSTKVWPSKTFVHLSAIID